MACWPKSVDEPVNPSNSPGPTGPTGPTTARQLLVHQQAHPLAVYALLDKTYGLDWIGWDPEVLWREIGQTFGRSISDLAKAKIQAIRSLLSADSFWSCWEVFSPTIMALSNRIPNWWIVQTPTPAQLYAGVDIADFVRRRRYSPEIVNFVVAVCWSAGLTMVRPPLMFARTALTGPRHECRRCGQHEHDDGPDDRCVACGSADLRRYCRLPVSPADEDRLALVVAGEYNRLTETAVDIQAAKTKVAVDYLRWRRAQLVEQLELVE